MLRDVFGEGIDYARVRIHPRKWWFVFPGNRPMAPNGHAYFPGETHVLDFAAPGVPRDTLQALVDQAHTVCPYSSATRGNIDVNLIVTDD